MSNNLDAWFGQNWGTVITSNVFFLLFAAAFIWLCLRFGSTAQERGLNFLSALIGALLGWGLGMFFAPYTSEEQAVFAGIGKTISAFMSGYVVSKVDRFLEGALFEDKRPILDSWIRMGILAGSLILALLFVFTNRLYFRAKAPAGHVAATSSRRVRAHPLDTVGAGGLQPNQLTERPAAGSACRFATTRSRQLVS